MNQQTRKDILNKMIDISKKVETHINTMQERGNITYYSDFQFKNLSLGVENIYVAEVKNKSEKGQTSIYELYDEEQGLIATVSEDKKVHFTEKFIREYVDKIKDNDRNKFEQIKLDEIDFELPEELNDNDIAMTKEELREHEGLERDREGRTEKEREQDKKTLEDKDKEEDKEEEKSPEAETENEKKIKTAEALGVSVEDIKSVCTINPNEKLTDKYNLIDIMPEAANYQEISIACSNSSNKQSDGQFAMIGIKKDGTREMLKSVEPIEGASTSKNVISVNEDGTKVTEKQVKGLFRINSRERNDGISVSIGDYGMMDVDYVSNVMDKETRRATPIRTREAQNQRIATAEVRENAGDSISEMSKEGKIYRAREKRGVDPQSLDGIDIDKTDGGKMTLKELKEHIKEEALKQDDLSRGELEQFIKSEISESGLQLTEDEIEMTTTDIQKQVVDELNFPTREDRRY